MRTLELPRLFDAHVHLRQGDLRDLVFPHTARQCAAAIAMPNTDPELTTPESVTRYCRALPDWVRTLFMLTPETDPATISKFPVWTTGAKLYPLGVTTHSAKGFSRTILENPDERLLDNLAALQENNLSFHVHPELPGSFVLESERDFIPFLDRVRKSFPQLKLTVEHVTDKVMCDWVARQPLDRVAATVTPHHLAWDLGALFQGGLRPGRYCKPVYKTPADRKALWRYALTNEHFFLGSDSAPHPSKLLPQPPLRCCAGVWNAPVLAESLVHLFDQNGVLPALPNFSSQRAWRFHYGTVPVGEPLRLDEQSWTVPLLIDGMEPFLANEILTWKLNDADQ